MSIIVGYQPGEWSSIAFDAGEKVTISVGRTSIWIYVFRDRLAPLLHRFVPSLLRRFPRLAAKRTLLWIDSVRRADGKVALFRKDDGTPLELGTTLLEVVTAALQEDSTLDQSRGSIAEIEMYLRGPLPAWLCFPPRFLEELESLPPDEKQRRMMERSMEMGLTLSNAAAPPQPPNSRVDPSTHRENVASPATGSGMWLAMLGGLAFLLSVVFKGTDWTGQKVFPLVTHVWSLGLFCAVLLLPLAFFRRTRAYAGNLMVVVSFLVGLSTWIWGFLVTYAFWGLLGLVVGLLLLGLGVVPLGLLAAGVHGRWEVFGDGLLLLLGLFVPRFLGIYLLARSEKDRQRAGV